MITLKSILVPTDFSKQSQSAIRYGIEFAKKFGAKLHVLHVVHDVSIFIPEMGFINPSAALSNIEPMLLAAGKSLADFLEPYKHHLIILGTHGHTGLKHLFLGSLAETLVRKSPCPVLSLRNPEHEFVSS